MKQHKPGGVKHWLAQRITALLLMPLIIYGTSGFVLNVGGDYLAARAWLAQPINATAILLLFGVGLLHGTLGLEVIIEDYVATISRRKAMLLLVKLIAIALAVLAAYCVITIALGGGA